MPSKDSPVGDNPIRFLWSQTLLSATEILLLGLSPGLGPKGRLLPVTSLCLFGKEGGADPPEKADLCSLIIGSQRIGSFPDRNRLIATRMAYDWHFSG